MERLQFDLLKKIVWLILIITISSSKLIGNKYGLIIGDINFCVIHN